MMDEEMKKIQIAAEEEDPTDILYDEGKTAEHVNNFLDNIMPKSFKSMPNYEDFRDTIIPQLYRNTVVYISQILSSHKTSTTESVDVIYRASIKEKVDIGLETDLCILRRKIHKNWKRLQTYGKLYRKYGGAISIDPETQFAETSEVVQGISLQDTNKINGIPKKISINEDEYNRKNILQSRVDKSRLTKSDTVHTRIDSCSKDNINMIDLWENKCKRDECHQYHCHTSESDELLFFKLKNNEDDNIFTLLEKRSGQISQSDIPSSKMNEYSKIFCVRKKCVKALRCLDNELFKEHSITSTATKKNKNTNASSGSSFIKPAPVTTEYLHKHCIPNRSSDTLCISFGNDCLKPNTGKEINIKDNIFSFKSVQCEIELNRSSSSTTKITIVRNPRDLTNIKNGFQLYHNYEKTLKKYRFHKEITNQTRSLCNLRVSLNNLKGKQKHDEQNKLKDTSIRHKRFLYNFSKRQYKSPSKEWDIAKHLQDVLKYVSECSQTCDINVIVNVNVNSNDEKTCKDNIKVNINDDISLVPCTSTSTEQLIKVMVYPTKTGVSEDENRKLIPIKESIDKISDEDSSIGCLIPESSKVDISCEKTLSYKETKIMIEEDILILKPVQIENEYLEPINISYLQHEPEKMVVQECKPFFESVTEIIKCDQCVSSKEIKIKLEQCLSIQEPSNITDTEAIEVEIKQDRLYLECIEQKGIKFENTYPYSKLLHEIDSAKNIPSLQLKKEMKEVNFKEYEPCYETIEKFIKFDQSVNSEEVNIDIEPCSLIQGPPNITDVKDVEGQIKQDKLLLDVCPDFNSPDEIVDITELLDQACKKRNLLLRCSASEPFRYKLRKSIGLPDFESRSSAINLKVTCVQQYNMEMSSMDVMNFRSSSLASFESEMLIKVTDMTSNVGSVRQEKNNIIVNAAETTMDHLFSSFDFGLEAKTSGKRQKLVAFVCDVFNKKQDGAIQGTRYKNRSEISTLEAFSDFNPWRRGDDAETCELKVEVPDVACSTPQIMQQERITYFQKFTTYTTNYLRTYFYRNQPILPPSLESVVVQDVKEKERVTKSQNYWKIGLIVSSIAFAVTVVAMYYYLNFKSRGYKSDNNESKIERDLEHLAQLGF